MKISKWITVVLCAGATLLGFVVAEAQQFAPRGQTTGGYPPGRAPARSYPAGQAYNPGVQAQPGRTYAARPVQGSVRSWQTESATLDADIAAQLALGNAEEIAMARLGAERAESDEVREFAEMLIQEHRDFLSRLDRVQPQIVAAYGRLSGARTAAWEDDRYDRRTTRRIDDEDAYDRRDGGSDRFDDFRAGSRGRSSDLDARGLRSDARSAGRQDADESEADFRSERSRAEDANRAGIDRTGTQRTGGASDGNRTDQPTGGDVDVGETGPGNNQTGTAGPRGTGAGSTGGVGTRTGTGRAEGSGSSGANTSDAGAAGTGAGVSGAGSAGGAGTGAGGAGAGTGGAGAGTGGAGASGSGAGGAGSGGTGGAGAGSGGAGGAGGSGASLPSAMKSYPVVFQAGSADENEDRQVPNRRRSGDVEDEGTTIGPNQTEPRGGYNQESTTQDNAGASRDDRRGRQDVYDEDDYRDSSRATSGPRDYEARDYAERRRAANSVSTRDYERGYAEDGYAQDYGDQRRARQRDGYSERYDPRRMTTSRTSQRTLPASVIQQPHLLLQRDVAERCLANAQRELRDKEGAEFDMAFMGMQIVAHNRMLATLEAARTHASPQLAELIDEGIETTERHLDHARGIVENLSRDQQRTSSRDRSSNR